MPDTQPSTQERVSDALKMGQEPKDRLWAAIYVLVALVLLLGALVFSTSRATSNTLEANRSLGLERGSLHCMTIIVDDDRDFGMPRYCQRSDVVVYYPPEICEEFFPDATSCGREWED